VRINQFVASASGLSRRAADIAIAGGRVTIGTRPAMTGESAPTDADIRLDGKSLLLPTSFTYLMLNKPTGYVSSRTQQGPDPTLYALLPADYRDLRITGRLDRDSSGLVILTDDGNFIHRYTHPSNGHSKTYIVLLQKPLTTSDRDRLAAGVELEDGPSFITVTARSGSRLTVTIGEGRNRQIRRTFGALGYTVESLHRTAVGGITLGRLAPGTYRQLSGEETQ
jgi:pseudouridine synthase